MPSPSDRPTIAEALLAWYDRHHRDLPWRVSPAQRRRGAAADPYRVWLSEIMLQQTTVEAVKPYYARFLAKWPSVEALAAADADDVMKAWAGLGYYSRARNLKACAEAVADRHAGAFPEDAETLRGLPGIGAYTSAAIAAIAFDRPAAVVDGNVERVVTRLFAIDTPLPQAKPAIAARVASLVPAQRPGDFAQATMDLGATICTPKRPACVLCPLREDCLALGHGDPALYPVKPAKAEKPLRRGAAFVAVDPAGAILLRKRQPKGLLGGMSEVPGSRWVGETEPLPGREAAPFEAAWRHAGRIAHVFTHFRLEVEVHAAVLARRADPAGGWWSMPGNLPGEALPTVMKKIIEAARPGATRDLPGKAS